MARHGRRAQAIHHDHPMRHAVDEPQAVGHVRAGLAEEQALREICAAGEFDLALLPLFRVAAQRSEEHTSELQSLMRLSYAVFCLIQKRGNRTATPPHLCDLLTRPRTSSNTPT